MTSVYKGAAACAAVLLLGMFAERTSSAEHFKVALRVKDGGSQVEAFMDTTPPIGGVNPRPVLNVRAGDEIQVAWRMTSAYPHGVMKGVGVHFFVVREAAVGQKPVPDPAGPAGIVDNSFTMDFAPGASASGAIRFHIDSPGNYLVRVQSENTWQEHGHEHFSAVDLVAN